MRDLHEAVKKAQTLGYIKDMKNLGAYNKYKDNSFWTQPLDPLYLKVQELKEQRNMHAEELWAHEYEAIETAFLPNNELMFVRNYAED